MGRGKAGIGEQTQAASPRKRKPGPRVIDSKNWTIGLGAWVIDEDGSRLQAKDFRAPQPHSGIRELVFLTESGEEETYWAEETVGGNFKISRFRLA